MNELQGSHDENDGEDDVGRLGEGSGDLEVVQVAADTAAGDEEDDGDEECVADDPEEQVGAAVGVQA